MGRFFFLNKAVNKILNIHFEFKYLDRTKDFYAECNFQDFLNMNLIYPHSGKTPHKTQISDS